MFSAKLRISPLEGLESPGATLLPESPNHLTKLRTGPEHLAKAWAIGGLASVRL